MKLLKQFQCLSVTLAPLCVNIKAAFCNDIPKFNLFSDSVSIKTQNIHAINQLLLKNTFRRPLRFTLLSMLNLFPNLVFVGMLQYTSKIKIALFPLLSILYHVKVVQLCAHAAVPTRTRGSRWNIDSQPLVWTRISVSNGSQNWSSSLVHDQLRIKYGTVFVTVLVYRFSNAVVFGVC